jgi:hypothetical protein
MGVLAGRPADSELVVNFLRADGRVQVRIDDPAPDRTAVQLRTGLADEVERLAALGGDLELIDPEPGPAPGAPLAVRAWLPDRLEPLVESSVGAELRAP